MKTQNLLIALFLFLIVTACKKPKEGLYQITFYNFDQYNNRLTTDVIATKTSDGLLIVEHNSRYLLRGSLSIRKTELTGTLYSSYSSGGSSSSSKYTLTGSGKRKHFEGTYTEEGQGQSYHNHPPDTVIYFSRTGQFTLEWKGKVKGE